MSPQEAEILSLALRGRADISASRLQEVFADWTVEPIRHKGKLVGTVLMKGPEIHVASTVKAVWLNRDLIRRTLGRIVDQYGYAVTSIAADNPKGLQFIQRLGFQPEGALYVLRKLRHV